MKKRTKKDCPLWKEVAIALALIFLIIMMYFFFGMWASYFGATPLI